MLSLIQELQRCYLKSAEGHNTSPASHFGQQGRATTWHAFNKDNVSERSRAVRSEPTRIRPTYPFPTLHLIQGEGSGDELEEDYVYTDRSNEKLVWVDALNKWVPQKQLQPRPYLSFIGNPPVIEKQGKPPREADVDGRTSTVFWTPDVHAYMTLAWQKDYTPINIDPRYSANNEKREAIRRRAQELAEQKRQRKAYSSPHYTSPNERKQRLKPHIQTTRTHSSLPVSPVQRREKVPSPKQVWQVEESPKLKTIHEPKPEPPPQPKREISITLVSPLPTEEPENIDDVQDKALDKRVSFDEENKTPEKPVKSVKEKKKKEGDFDPNLEDTESKLAEQRLIESLEKQQQQQLVEQQKLLEEQQRIEKERLEEEERLRKLKEAQNLQKQPLSTKSQNQDNCYENTMNAAGKKKKGKAASKAKPKPEKVEKTQKKIKKVEEEKPKAEPKPKPKPKHEPPSKPMLAGMGPPQKPVPALVQATKAEKKEEKLPITKPSEVQEVPQPVVTEEVKKPQSPVQEKKKSILEREAGKEIVKKERKEVRRCVKKVEEEKKPLPELELPRKRSEDWIYESEDFSESKETDKVSTPEAVQLPELSLTAVLNPELIEKEKREKKEKQRKFILAQLISGDKSVKKLRKTGQLDSSYADELRRLELAEERRKKQMEMFEKIKNRNLVIGEKVDDGSPRFEDYGFLSRYCIFTKGNIEMYRHAFEAVDETGSGWLEGEDVMIALRGVNNKLTEAEEEYLYRVLELTGFKLTHGADFKMFSVLAALSQKISALDKWMKNLIGQMDFKALEMKMFKCKTLWECNVDEDTNSISIDQLCVELRAGGVSFEHEMEVRAKLSHLHALDLLDFLTYVPLFIMIHESVVENPLCDTRNK